MTEVLRDGQAKFHREANGTSAFADTCEDPGRARNLMSHMDAFNSSVADELASRIGWRGYAPFLDVGGARGNVAARLVTAHPHLPGGVFALPGLRPLFDELAGYRVSHVITADTVTRDRFVIAAKPNGRSR
jgi:O-methyltransferase domain